MQTGNNIKQSQWFDEWEKTNQTDGGFHQRPRATIDTGEKNRGLELDQKQKIKGKKNTSIFTTVVAAHVSLSYNGLLIASHAAITRLFFIGFLV